MTNTYEDDAPMETKMCEEIRCVRCVLERLLNHLSSGLFKDYQMEKFSGSPESRQKKKEFKT